MKTSSHEIKGKLRYGSKIGGRFYMKGTDGVVVPTDERLKKLFPNLVVSKSGAFTCFQIHGMEPCLFLSKEIEIDALPS